MNIILSVNVPIRPAGANTLVFVTGGRRRNARSALTNETNDTIADSLLFPRSTDNLHTYRYRIKLQKALTYFTHLNRLYYRLKYFDQVLIDHLRLRLI